MSLIPRNTSNTPAPFTPFTQDFWDHFFSPDHWPHPFPSLFHSPFPFLSPARTIPYSELSIETTGSVRARLECKELPEAHLIVAELPGLGRDEVDVAAEDGGFVRISGGDGRFAWRMRLPEYARVEGMSWSMENGVLTVVVPKFAAGEVWWPREVRPVEITGPDE